MHTEGIKKKESIFGILTTFSLPPAVVSHVIVVVFANYFSLNVFERKRTEKRVPRFFFSLPHASNQDEA